MPKRELCYAYLRTSSASNIDGDSPHRQGAAIDAFAESNGFEVVACFYDAGVGGDDLLEDRPGFSGLLDAVEGNGVDVVIIESADRLARKSLVQEVGIIALQKRGIRCLTSSGMDLTDDSDEYRVAMRQVAAAFSQLEKTRLVRKLKAGRDRRRAETGRCEGRKPPAAELVKEAKRLHRKSPKTGKRRSLRTIAQELAAAGYVSPTGKAYSHEGIRQLVNR